MTGKVSENSVKKIISFLNKSKGACSNAFISVNSGVNPITTYKILEVLVKYNCIEMLNTSSGNMYVLSSYVNRRKREKDAKNVIKMKKYMKIICKAINKKENDS